MHVVYSGPVPDSSHRSASEGVVTVIRRARVMSPQVVNCKEQFEVKSDNVSAVHVLHGSTLVLTRSEGPVIPSEKPET